MLKTGISQLLEKEMDRTEFLKHAGIAVIALTGASSVLKMLVQQPVSTTHKQVGDSSSRLSGYGSTAYGGSEAGL